MTVSHNHDTDLATLQTLIGHEFETLELLERALTHRSYVNEVAEAEANNQRMEFLGDSVLGLVVAQILFGQFPDAEEGPLSGALSRLVCESALAEVVSIKFAVVAVVSQSYSDAESLNTLSNSTRPSSVISKSEDADEALRTAMFDTPGD